jgi:hypothetical protein
LSKKWYHIHLSVDQDNSTVFIDGQQKQTRVSNIEIKQGTTVDLNITLGGKLETSIYITAITWRCIESFFFVFIEHVININWFSYHNCSFDLY